MAATVDLARRVVEELRLGTVAIRWITKLDALPLERRPGLVYRGPANLAGACLTPAQREALPDVAPEQAIFLVRERASPWVAAHELRHIWQYRQPAAEGWLDDHERRETDADAWAHAWLETHAGPWHRAREAIGAARRAGRRSPRHGRRRRAA